MVKASFQRLFFCFSLLLVMASAQSQDLLKIRDLSRLSVETLTDADIIKIRQQLAMQNVTIDQVRPLLINRGLSLTEFSKLKKRIETTQLSKKSSTGKLRIDELELEERRTKDKKLILDKDALMQQELEQELEDSLLGYGKKKKEIKPLIDPRIYGAELFNKTPDDLDPQFESNLFNMATPVNYEVGPGDLVQLVVYGQQELDEELEITREGNMVVPRVGIVKIGGMTVEAATAKLKSAMSQAYPTLRTGASKISLTLGEIRTIHITVVGANKSGTYDVPSLYSVYAVLSQAGGPTNLGSFRNIELVRNSKVIRTIDLYRLLAKGDQSDNLRLIDNDVIRIPAYQTRVELSGQVKRPGLYEVIPSESFADILAFAGGFDDTAYTASVKVIRKGDKEREVKDLPSSNYNSFMPAVGDQFVVNRILNRYSNRVNINGAVFRPDMYELKPGMKISDLIALADGPAEDAFLDRGILIRQREDLTKEMMSVNLLKIIQKDPAHDLLLKKEDELLVSSIIDLRDSLKVTLQGEVRIPGEYHFVEGMTLKALILHAGGFTDAASENIEIAHLIVRDSVGFSDTRSSEIQNIRIQDTLSFSDLDLPVKPYDVITVRKKPAYNKLETVLVVGQVQFPGPYALKDAKERVSDLFKRIGGTLPDANLDGAYLKRFKTEEEKKRIADDARRMQRLFADSSSNVLSDVEKEFDRIPLNMAALLKNPGSTADVILKSRDELIIPKLDAQVRVSGAVLQSTQIPFEDNKNFRSYIYSAGGFSRDAWRRSAYIVYANGRASTTKRFLGIKNYPRVLPGAEIIVPKEPASKGRISTGEIIGLSSAIASLAGVAIALLSL